MTVDQLVERIGRDRVSRATVFRIHGGQAVPALPVVKAWLDVTEADDPTRARVLDVLDVVHREMVSWRDYLGGRTDVQDEIAVTEREAVRIRTFQPTVVPGLLQAPEYARRLAPISSTGEVDADVTAAGKLERQGILREQGRRFEFIVTESVIRGIPTDLADEQLEWMRRLAELPTVELRVLPDSAWVATAWHNFAILDTAEGHSYASVELIHGPFDAHAEEDVAWYLRLWDRLWDASEEIQE